MTTPTAPVLMACPAGEHRLRANRTKYGFFIECMNIRCGWTGPWRDTKAEAIAAWNYRQTPVDSGQPKR